MRIIFLSILWFFLIQNAFSQLSGKLTDAENQPIPFANILLLNARDTALVKGTMTNDMGEYEIENTSPGNYFLRYSAIGFQTYNSPAFELTARQERKTFGIQMMHEDTQQLEELIIQAEKPLYQQQTNGMVVNVESSVLTKGSSALEVLERSPGVIIDHRNSSISLNGKSGVMVMLNGKLMRMPANQVVTLLNGMNANNIEKIELLTTPPVRYDADGNAGMINIVLKKNEEYGTQGSVALTGGYGWGEKASTSTNFTHNTGKISLYGSYAFSHDRSNSDWYATSTQNMPALGGELSVNFWNLSKPTSNSHNATLGLEGSVGKTNLGGSITYNHSRVNADIFNRGEYVSEPDSFLLMKTNIDALNRWNNIITNVYVEKEIREGEKINLDIDYLYYKNENPTEVYASFLNNEESEVVPNGNIFATRQRGISNTPIQVGVVKLDYVKQWHPNLKFEAGVKGTYTQSSSLSKIETLTDGQWESNPRTSNDIDIQEGIGAIYSSFQWQISPTTQLEAGARYEYAEMHTKAEKEEYNIDRKYGNLFPSLFFSKQLNEKSEVQFSYTKRISRPTYNDLASFMLYTDPMSVFTGNPALKPTITHNLKVGYNFSGYAISILLSHDDNPIVGNQLSESPARDLMYVSSQNMDYQNNLTFQTELPFHMTEWWNMHVGFVGGWRQFKLSHTKEKFEKTYFGFSLSGSQTFALPANFSLEISGWYNGPSYYGSVKFDGFGMLNAGIKKEFTNNMGSLQLSVTDLLQSMNIHNYFGRLTEEAFSLKSHVNFHAESAKAMIIKLTYSKSFGNNQVKSKTKRDSGSKDERERIRNN